MQRVHYRSLAAGHCLQPRLATQSLGSHSGLRPVLSNGKSSNSSSSSTPRRNITSSAADSDWGELPVAAPSWNSSSTSGGSSAAKRPASSKQRSNSSSRGTADGSSSWYEAPSGDEKVRSPKADSSRSNTGRNGNDTRDTRSSSSSSRSRSASSVQQQQQPGAQRRDSRQPEHDDSWSYSSSSSRGGASQFSSKEEEGAPNRDLRQYSSRDSNRQSDSSTDMHDSGYGSSSNSRHAAGPVSSSSGGRYRDDHHAEDAWDRIGHKFGINSSSSSSSSTRYAADDRFGSSSNSEQRWGPPTGSRSRYTSGQWGSSDNSGQGLTHSLNESSSRSSSSSREKWGTPSPSSSSSSIEDRSGDTRWGSSYRSSSSSRGGDGTAASASSRQQQRKEKKEKKAAALTLSKQPCCYGCGAPLQTTVASAAGYVAPAKYQLKQQHRQLHKVLCARCSGLCNGAMIPAVEDFTQKAWAQHQAALMQQQTAAATDEVVPMDSDFEAAQAAAAGDGQLELLGKLLVTPEQLRQKLTEVRSVKALVVLLVDLLDASGTLMSKVRDMVGNNPIVLVGTKMDLLPPGCRPKDVADWLTEAAARRRLLVTSAHLVSSHTGEGIAAVTSKVCRERKGRDVFVVGAANVGKSAFVRAMLKEMSSLTGGNFDAAALATRRYLPVESAMPGTTLGLIPLQAFETGGTLYDTPGVHLHHRIPHMLTPGELRLLHPRKRLTAFLPPAPWQILQEQQQDDPEYEETDPDFTLTDPARAASGRSSTKPKDVSATYLWSGLVRVDVLSAPRSCALVFYSPRTMRVYGLPLLEEGQEVDIDLGDDDADAADAEDAGSSSSSDGDEEQPSQDCSSSNATTSSSSSSKGGILFCKDSVAARGGLVPHSLVVKSPIPTSACLADIAVSGLPGWVGVYAPFSKQDVVLRVWVPRGVEVFLRPPLPCPPPPSPKGSEEPEELLDIGRVLARAEQDQEWEAARKGLGLESNTKMTAQDEEILKMLMFGDENAGLQGIVDLEEARDEDEGSMQEAEEAEQQLQQPVQLAVRAEEVVLGRRRRSSRSSSSLVGVRGRSRGAAAADPADDLHDAEFAAGAAAGEGWVTIPTTAEELGLPAAGLNDEDSETAAGTSSGRPRRRRVVSRR